MQFTKLNLVFNTALAVTKGVVGFLSGSRALVAGALYSINDVLSAIIVIISLKVGRRPADEEHTYGYGKAEFVALALMSFVMVAGVFFIIFYSVVDIVRGVEGPPHVASLPVAALAVVTNEYLARRGFCAARTLGGSPALYTSAEHNRADALSSIAVLIGVGGATLGLHVLDQIVAIIETAHICWLSGTLFGRSARGLMDTALPREEIDHVARSCYQVDGVLRVLQIRTRLAGTVTWVDVVFTVSRELAVAQAAEVADRVQAQVIAALNRKISVHVRFLAEPPGSRPTSPSTSDAAVSHG